MNKDNLDNLFKGLEGTFNIEKTPEGHQKRFLDKLNTSKNKGSATEHSVKRTGKSNSWWKPLSIAASIAVLFAVGSLITNNTEVTEVDLASVSPEMQETQTFFTTTINEELSTLKSFQSPETKALVDDALIQMSTLEKKYDKLKIDLAESGNDKRVIYAMISNFQSRIDLLEEVISTIEEVKNYKTDTDENKITI